MRRHAMARESGGGKQTAMAMMPHLNIVVETILFARDLRDAHFAKFLHNNLVDN